MKEFYKERQRALIEAYLDMYVVNPVKRLYNHAKPTVIAMSAGFIAALLVLGLFHRDYVVSTVREYYSAAVNSASRSLSIDMGMTDKELEDQRVGEYVLFIMNFSKSKTSDFQKQLMAQTIVRVSGSVFDTAEERKWAVILVNNESGFDRMAKSPAGAVGLTQVMPQFVEEFGGHCGIKGIEKNEVADMETNLLLGFCRFKYLLKCYGGVYSTALAAYNGGKNAKSVKELQSLARITTTETLQYIARFTHVKATADAHFNTMQPTTPFKQKKVGLVSDAKETIQVNSEALINR